MKIIYFLIVLVIPNKLTAADLEVTVKGIRTAKGVLRVAIFDDPKEFPRGDEIRSLNVKARSGNTIAIFSGINSGVYALAIHHDENNNKEMDTNFIGLPKEGYGFSNDAKVFLGPPHFTEASFFIGNTLKKISLQIVY